jgi:hypothetical protein
VTAAFLARGFDFDAAAGAASLNCWNSAVVGSKDLSSASAKGPDIATTETTRIEKDRLQILLNGMEPASPRFNPGLVKPGR